MFNSDEHYEYSTMSDAHREWHRNSGVPMGTPGCPQDACHPVEDDPTHMVVDPDGEEHYCYDYADARATAVARAALLGRAVKVVVLP